MNKNLALFVIIGLVIVGLGIGLALRQKEGLNQSNDQEKLRVAATFYPLAFLAERIGGSHVSVLNMTPAGAEPHDFEPTPQDQAKLERAKLFLINGNGVDAWALEGVADRQAKGTEVIVMSDQLNNLLPEDPHFWLDPVLMQQQARLITQALEKLDPARTTDYRQQEQRLLGELANLDASYKTGLANCQQQEIVVSHDAASYLAKRYTITVNPIAGLSPEEEPTAKRLAELTELVKEKNIGYIFFETLVTPKLAETLAQETGAKTLVFNPIEGLSPEELAEGKSYLTLMQDNLTNLKIAMQCQ